MNWKESFDGGKDKWVCVYKVKVKQEEGGGDWKVERQKYRSEEKLDTDDGEHWPYCKELRVRYA